MEEGLVAAFMAAVGRVGGEPIVCKDIDQAIAHIAQRAGGVVLIPPFPAGQKIDLAARLREGGCQVAEDDFRAVASRAAAGVTGANFALADTGTVVLESTAEPVRLATTLPERHFVLLDPRKILADGRAAIPLMRELHRRQPRNYVAYITGPSRTADIERVLTIGVHGPRELHVLLVEGLSEDPMEM